MAWQNNPEDKRKTMTRKKIIMSIKPRIRLINVEIDKKTKTDYFRETMNGSVQQMLKHTLFKKTMGEQLIIKISSLLPRNAQP